MLSVIYCENLETEMKSKKKTSLTKRKLHKDKHVFTIGELLIRKRCIIPLIGIIFFIIFFYNCNNLRDITVIVIHNYPKVNIQYVTVHIDLKGAPPKIDYLISLLPHLKNLGVNSLLMEYEDMFPYNGTIVNISTTTFYTEKELKYFLEEASKLDIEVIPLLQLFGNMEHVLKLREFLHLREDLTIPSMFCPLKDYLPVVSEMLTQVIKFHSAIAPLKHIHIGCNEVDHLMECDECKKKIKKNSTIFLNHMKFVGKTVKDLAPDATVILWDDILQKLNLNYADYKLLGGLFKIEPVVWDPTPQISKWNRMNLHKLMNTYHKAFKNIWIAPAYRGVDYKNGRETMIPDIKNRLLNQLNWLHLIREYTFPDANTTYDFKGIVLSGWSRRRHFEPINELFPVSLESLINCLKLIEKFRTGKAPLDIVERFSVEEWDNIYTKYFEDIDLEIKGCEENSKSNINSAVCRIYSKDIQEFQNIMKGYETDLENSKKIHLYNPESFKVFDYCDRKFIKNQLEFCKNLHKSFSDAENKLKLYMASYFHKTVINVYFRFKGFSALKRINNCLKYLNEIMNKTIWKNGRSLPSYTDLSSFYMKVRQ